MHVREQRRNVVINTRLRCGAAWLDARILNISSRGLGLHSPAPPDRGSYVEVRRGPHVIIARVVWVKGNRFGVRAQDAVPIDAVIRDPDSSGRSSERTANPAARVERRSSVRSPDRRHEASRTAARAMEFALLVLLGASAALLAFGMMKQAIGSPLADVRAALTR